MYMYMCSLTRAQLISEVHSLSRERSSLVRQLEESTATFEQQLNEISNTCKTLMDHHPLSLGFTTEVDYISPGTVKLANAEAQLNRVQGENHSLNEEFSQLKHDSEALTEKEEELKLRVEELESELREARTTMETSQFLYDIQHAPVVHINDPFSTQYLNHLLVLFCLRS